MILFAVLIAVCVGAFFTGRFYHKKYHPPHHLDHWFAAGLVWSFGAAIISAVCFLIFVFNRVASCTAVMIDPNTQEFAPRLVDGCGDSHWVSLWLVLTPWQTGIGAGLGLLGLAWSTLYRSVYEDWIKHKPLEASNAP